MRLINDGDGDGDERTNEQTALRPAANQFWLMKSAAVSWDRGDQRASQKMQVNVAAAQRKKHKAYPYRYHIDVSAFNYAFTIFCGGEFFLSGENPM